MARRGGFEPPSPFGHWISNPTPYRAGPSPLSSFVNITMLLNLLTMAPPRIIICWIESTVIRQGWIFLRAKSCRFEGNPLLIPTMTKAGVTTLAGR